MRQKINKNQTIYIYHQTAFLLHLSCLLRVVSQAITELAQQLIESVDRHEGLPGDGQLPLESEMAEENQLPEYGDEGLNDLFLVLIQPPAEAELGH